MEWQWRSWYTVRVSSFCILITLWMWIQRLQDLWPVIKWAVNLRSCCYFVFPQYAPILSYKGNFCLWRVVLFLNYLEVICSKFWPKIIFPPLTHRPQWYQECLKWIGSFPQWWSCSQHWSLCQLAHRISPLRSRQFLVTSFSPWKSFSKPPTQMGIIPEDPKPRL